MTKKETETPDIGKELDLYCEKVINGEIIACLKHKWACMRYLSDRSKENDPNWPFRFDNEKAEKFFAWTRLFKHRKGVLRGQYIKLVPLQRFIFGNVFGWVYKDTNLRRFSKMYWQVARKNAKSQSLALVLTYMCFADNEEAAEVYCAATKRDQARVVYDECEAMVRKGLPKDKWKIAYCRIEHPKSGSFIRYLSKEDKKLGDGYNPHAAAVDEYHAHDTSEMYDVLASGMGAREQPIHATITTAGFDLEFPCYKTEYLLVSKILDPSIEVNLENYFCMVNELDKDDQGELIDDIKDEKVWIKSNPIVATYPSGIKGLRDDFNEAIGITEKMRNYLTKRMNIWVNMRECGYMDMEKWKSCGKGYDIRYLRGQSCFIGLDMSAKIDLASFCAEFQQGDKYYIYSHSFMPESTVRAKLKTDKVPYLDWINQGYLTLTPGAAIDYRAIKDYIVALINQENWKVEEFCVDSWGAIQISGDLIDLYGQDKVVEIVQGIKTLSEPTKNFREMVYMGRVVHDNNPVLSWAMSNAIIDTPDRSENIILNKKKSIQRIDPVAAIINAHTRAMNNEPRVRPKVVFI